MQQEFEQNFDKQISEAAELVADMYGREIASRFTDAMQQDPTRVEKFLKGFKLAHDLFYADVKEYLSGGGRPDAKNADTMRKMLSELGVNPLGKIASVLKTRAQILFDTEAALIFIVSPNGEDIFDDAKLLPAQFEGRAASEYVLDNPQLHEFLRIIKVLMGEDRSNEFIAEIIAKLKEQYFSEDRQRIYDYAVQVGAILANAKNFFEANKRMHDAKKVGMPEVALLEDRQLAEESWGKIGNLLQAIYVQTVRRQDGFNFGPPPQEIMLLPEDNAAEKLEQVRNKIITLLSDMFSMDELRELSFDLFIRFEDLPERNTLTNTARSIVTEMEKREKGLVKLVEEISAKRPAVADELGEFLQQLSPGK